MKDCKYTLVGKRQYNHSYDELIKILKKSPQLAYDILYSKDYNRQTRVVDKLSELKEAGKRKFKKEFSDRVDVLNGCAEVNASGYTTQSFIDSGLYIDQLGKQIMPVLQVEDYIDRMASLYEQKGLSKDEIEKHISILRNSWKRIAELLGCFAASTPAKTAFFVSIDVSFIFFYIGSTVPELRYRFSLYFKFSSALMMGIVQQRRQKKTRGRFFVKISHV